MLFLVTSFSDVITRESISLTFTLLDGPGRRPINRFCGPTPEQPSTYESYSELTEELSSLVNEKVLGLSTLFDSFSKLRPCDCMLNERKRHMI